MAAFPENQEDAVMFINNAVKIIHNEQFQQSFIAALSKGGDPAQVVGSQAATIMHRLVSVMRQEKQMPILENVAIKGIKFVVEELSSIAGVMGVQLQPEQMAQAGKVAGDMTEQLMNDSEKSMSQPQQQAPPPQQQQSQGLMGGM